MFARIVPQVLNKYGLEFASVHPAQKGYRSESYAINLADGSTANLIFFKREPAIVTRIQRADHAASIAAGARLPVRVRRDKRLLRIQGDTYAGLYDYLPGQTVPWESFTMKHIKLLGMAMADLHSAFREGAPLDNYTVGDELEPLVGRMHAYFERSDVVEAMANKLGVSVPMESQRQLSKLVRYISHLPGQQVLHMDMVRGNVLFDTASSTDHWQIDSLALKGVIDFEKTAIGHPLFDIARTLAFLLVDSPKPSAGVYKYFLYSGYHKRGGQPLPDLNILKLLIRLFMLHDFYKFLRHTPYESLRDNYHYIRTRDILRTYGMIK